MHSFNDQSHHSSLANETKACEFTGLSASKTFSPTPVLSTVNESVFPPKLYISRTNSNIINVTGEVPPVPLAFENSIFEIKINK